MEIAPASDPGDDLVFASGSHCAQGSSVMVYPMSSHRDPFEFEDVRSDFPDGRIGTMGVPILGPAMGIYSSFTRCYDDGEELLFGFVANRVRTPDWDPDGIERHFLITHLFYGDTESSHHLGEWLGVHVDPLVSGSIELLAAGTYHVSFSTGTNMGVYDQIVEAPPATREAPETIRLWAPFKSEESRSVQYRSIDIQDTFGESRSNVGASGNGFILHWMNDLHGPTVAGEAVSAAGQPSWSEHYSGFSRSISYGPTFS